MTRIALGRMVIKKEYLYENGIISITLPDGHITSIKSATEIFLKKVMEERIQNGNSNQT